MNTFIYALREPDTGEIRYIGKANDLQERLRMHVEHAYIEKNHRACWVRSLLEKGKKPIIEIVDEVSFEDWAALEAAYIQFYLEEGCRLVNGTFGGEGFGILSEEVRLKIKMALKGRKISDETRRKMSLAHRGKQLTSEHRKNLSLARLGNTNKKGKKHTEEFKERCSERCSGKGNPFFGKRHTQETKDKMRHRRHERIAKNQ